MSSSDSRPSFRAYSKNKIKKVIKSNITSSIREHFISNETNTNIREKFHNITNTIKEQPAFEKIKNKTIGLIPNVLRPDNNSTSPKGFYDSLFSPQTENDVYLKVAIISLWVIAMLCIILTIITMFIPVGKNRGTPVGVKMIFFHIFLCEFFYLIYILLSMINVGLNFQLNFFWCNIAKYGMYVTIPVMYFALLMLSIERVTTYCNSATSWIKIFANTCVTQFILIFIWTIFIVVISLIIYMKVRFTDPFRNLPEKILPTRFNFTFGKKFSSNRCSIDGQLLPPFKILFLILFIILIVLIIKSMVLSVTYNFFKPSCCKRDKKTKKINHHNMTIIFIIFLLLNLFLSFPVYVISAGDSIKQLILGGKTFPMRLKISFILRIASIILQCLIFSTLEGDSWSLLNKLLHHATCKKIPAPNVTKRPSSTKQPRNSNIAKKNVKSDSSDTDPDENNDDTKPSVTDDSDDDDDVFINETKKNPLNAKKSDTTDESDDETKAMQKQKLSVKKKDINGKLSEKNHEAGDEELPIKKTTSKHNDTNGISKQTSNGKSTSQQTSAATTDRKSSKSNTNQNRTKYDPILSDSSADEISNASVNSDDEIRPSISKPTIQPTTQPTTRSSSNKRKRTPTVLANEHRSHHQRHRTTRSQVSRPRTTTSNNHNHTETAKTRKQSPRNINNHSKKTKQDRLAKILANSDEV